MQTSNIDRRLTYLNAVQLCKDKGIDVGSARPAYGYLRSEIVLQTGQSAYTLPLLEQQSFNGVMQANTEKRLLLQDNFVVGSKGVFMYFRNKVTNKPFSDLLTYLGFFNLPAGWAHGNNSWLPRGAPMPVTFNGLNNAFWQDAYMKYTMDYDVSIPRYDILQHWNVPIQQASIQTVAIPPVAADSNYNPTLDQRDGLGDGFIPMEPNIVLSGAKNVEINYILPYSIDFINELGWINPVYGTDIEARIAVIYRGILLQNTTNVR